MISVEIFKSTDSEFAEIVGERHHLPCDQAVRVREYPARFLEDGALLTDVMYQKEVCALYPVDCKISTILKELLQQFEMLEGDS